MRTKRFAIIGVNFLTAAAFVAVCDLLTSALDPKWGDSLNRILMFMGLAVAWNIIGGLGGQLGLGHAVFFGVGCYAAGWLTGHVHPALAVIVASAMAAIISVIFIPSFRTRGAYFAVITVALAFVALKIVSVWGPGASSGIFYSAIYSRVVVTTLYSLGTALSVATFVLTRRSKLGWALRAVRSDPDAARSLGVNEVRAKSVALLLSAGLTGYLGAIYALALGYMDPPTAFSINWSVAPLLACVLGGLGWVQGALIGGLVWSVLQDAVGSGAWSLVLEGGILLLVVLAMPRGIWGSLGTALWVKRRPSRSEREPAEVTKHDFVDA